MTTPTLKLARDNHRPPTRKINFTIAALEKIKPPASGRAFVYDTRQPGLALRISPTGHKVFYLNRWVGTKPVKMKLGNLADLSIEQARARVLEQGPTIARGDDPAAAKRERRGDMTLGAMYELFKDAPSKRTKQAKSTSTLANYEQLWKSFLPTWQAKKLSTITRDDVAALHKRIGKTASYQANRLAALLSAMYELAPKFGYRGLNPARGVERFKEKSNMRFVRDDELQQFLQAVRADHNQIAADAILTLLFTGARRTNVLSMRWKEIDFEAATWHIPKAKGGEPLSVALSQQALNVLAHRHKHRDATSPFVFPSKRAKAGHLEGVRVAIERAVKRAGMAHLRVHDLRHTLASLLVNSGVSLPVVGRQLGHRTLSTTMKYAHVDLTTARAGLNHAMDSVMKGGK